jgi:lipoate-protein ligase A
MNHSVFTSRWIECNVQKIQGDMVNLVRRKSGGGCVYQDLGNMCFTFVSGRKNTEQNNQILVNALKPFGIEASPSGRNDIHVGERKISGSAFNLQAGMHLHHGTMLMDVDIEAMQKYLNPNTKKLASKGIKSVSSRVVNLKELNKSINFNTLGEAIVKSFFEMHGETCPIEEVKVDEYKPLVQHEFGELSSQEWIFGRKTPDFKHRFETRLDWGMIDVHIDSKNGKIAEIVVYSDSLFPNLITELMKLLTGVDYTIAGVERALIEARNRFPSMIPQIDSFEKWFLTSL